MKNSSSNSKTLIAFFLLTFLLSVPFYILNALAYHRIFGKPEIGALYIALFTVTPIASASILTFRGHGKNALKELIGRIFDFKRAKNKQWYIVSLFLTPLIFVLSLTVMVLLGTTIPPSLVPFATLPVVLLLFFVLAAREEVGWMGYAFESMQVRSSALQASLILGILWAFWHVLFLSL